MWVFLCLNHSNEALDSVSDTLKVRGPCVQTFCIEKDSHMDAILTRIKIPLNGAYLFRNKENEILFVHL